MLRIRSVSAAYTTIISARGARLLRTNTFAANRYLLESDGAQRREIIKKGYEIAMGCAAGKDVFVAADIGPISSISESEKDISNDQKLDE